LILGLTAALACARRSAPAAEAAPAPQQPSTPAAAAVAVAAVSAETPAPPQGQEFLSDVRLLYRIAACGGDDPLPENVDPALVKEHCAWLAAREAKYRKDYVEGAAGFIAKLRPTSLPKTVVYPFGGGDILSALTTYPELTEVTTLSLEHAGDPRRLKTLDAKRLGANLALLRRSMAGLLSLNDSTSENLISMERADIPGQLSFFMMGLAVHGYEPVSLRYFRLEPDGALHYLTAEDIAAAEKTMAKKLNAVWVSPNFSEAFSNAEIRFRKRGASEGEPIRVHRHIAANLSDQYLLKDRRVLAHLEQKGEVSAMTKAASYLLWNGAFVKIREYLLGHMVFMVSDSTGIPPRFAKRAGFVQETYGQFTGPFLEASKLYSDEFVKLWSEQPRRVLPFRYGYPEAAKHWHMLVTRRAAADAKVGGV
jgi:hypothetical protein